MINNFFNLLDEKDGGQIFAKYLPQGKAWSAKNIINSNFFKLIDSLTKEDNKLRDCLNQVVTQFDITITDEFLGEWEKQLGIPDGCFTTDVSIERRRNQCLAKIKARGVQTTKDLQEIISILGYSATISTRFAQDPQADPNIASYELLLSLIHI